MSTACRTGFETSRSAAKSADIPPDVGKCFEVIGYAGDSCGNNVEVETNNHRRKGQCHDHCLELETGGVDDLVIAGSFASIRVFANLRVSHYLS